MAADPVRYSPEVAQALLELIAGGMSLRKACAQDGMPSPPNFRAWRLEREELQTQYARARAERAQHRADEIIEIADDEEIPVESRKVRIDARKWEASKLDRANYGDRQQVEHSGGVRLDVVTGVPEPSPDPSAD